MPPKICPACRSPPCAQWRQPARLERNPAISRGDGQAYRATYLDGCPPMTNPASGKVLAPANIGRFPQSGNGDCHLPQTGHPLVPWHSPLPQKTHPKSDIQTSFLPKSTIFAALHSYCHAAMFAQKTISLLLFCLFCPAPFLHARNSFPPAVSPQSRIHAPQKDSAFFSRKDVARPDPTASRRMKAPDALGMHLPECRL